MKINEIIEVELLGGGAERENWRPNLQVVPTLAVPGLISCFGITPSRIETFAGTAFSSKTGVLEGRTAVSSEGSG